MKTLIVVAGSFALLLTGAGIMAQGGTPQEIVESVLREGPSFLQRLLEVLKVYPWAGPAVIITGLVVAILRAWRGKR